MTTAFVFSGGGSLGSIEAGMLVALTDAGITPDLVVGASVGAINAAWFANHPDAEGARSLAAIWHDVGRNDVFPIQLVNGFLGFVGLRDGLLTADALRRLLAAHLDYTELQDAAIPVHLIAADLTSGHEVVLSTGNAIDALAASSAIPGVFPPVVIDGQHLVDGGIVDNAPISVAVEAGADTVYVLPTGYTCAPDGPPHGALGVAMQAVTLMVHDRLDRDVTRYRDLIDLQVVPPLCPLAVSPTDFSHTDELIARAEGTTRAWLDSSAKARRAQHDHLKRHRHEPVAATT